MHNDIPTRVRFLKSTGSETTSFLNRHKRSEDGHELCEDWGQSQKGHYKSLMS